MSDNLCKRCGADPHGDIRTLWMKCLYDMSELTIPFTKRDDGFFTIGVCKDCRADWLGVIEKWFNTSVDRSDERND